MIRLAEDLTLNSALSLIAAGFVLAIVLCLFTIFWVMK